MRSSLLNLAAGLVAVLACDSCYGPSDEVVHERLVRRIQPESTGSSASPRAPLEWGQLNFLHTTDTHGWLEGHLKEQNYGADWGDFVSFQRHMKQKARDLGVDLLLVDTGDLHDGAGLSDATPINGVLTNDLFDEIDYDVLAIGNHELYESENAYEHFYNFSKVWGDKYVTSNVQIYNTATSTFEYVGSKYRYFTTEHGLRIMTFGVLFDFTGNSNVSKVIKAADMVEQDWFLEAVNYDQPIDLFLLIGHNPIRNTDIFNTFELVHKTIRSIRPSTPVQIFGGHTHIRDFQVYDDTTTALESGRYCETLGWLSMSGINSTSYTGLQAPHGVPNPSRKASNTSKSGLVYSRRYLDWNRRTFEYHATNSQASTFDLHSGLRVSSEINTLRNKLNLTSLYGCAPATYCVSCKPFGDPGNIFTLVPVALGATVINVSRADIPRYIFVNTGSIRFDLVKGPFTYDDSFIVSPFDDAFLYIPSVPYDIARRVLGELNGAELSGKRSEGVVYSSLSSMKDTCVDPTIGFVSGSEPRTSGITRRQKTVVPGYVTTDDFGTDGDDTPHSDIPSYTQPNFVQGNGSFPATGNPEVVDVVFLDFFASTLVGVLNSLGGNYTGRDVAYYVDKEYTSQNYLPDYAKVEWQANVPNCPAGKGVGFDD
ncbi:calcineurin-like phosphoesterase [Diplocarpon mali]|nr:calcineurin-like phosphoesterase [Diplocarpon mali]